MLLRMMDSTIRGLSESTLNVVWRTLISKEKPLVMGHCDEGLLKLFLISLDGGCSQWSEGMGVGHGRGGTGIFIACGRIDLFVSYQID